MRARALCYPGEIESRKRRDQCPFGLLLLRSPSASVRRGGEEEEEEEEERNKGGKKEDKKQHTTRVHTKRKGREI